MHSLTLLSYLVALSKGEYSLQPCSHCILMDCAGAFGYADDSALVSPSLYCLHKMIGICDMYANGFYIIFNPKKIQIIMC